jgi:hypothetical protein
LLLLSVPGCTSGGSGATVQRAHDRALEIESPERFFSSILAKATGKPDTDKISPVAREQYLTIIAESENRSKSERTSLRNEGLLGNDLVIRALAEWRLGRLDDALVSIKEARATGQEAVSARDRALAAALDGVVQLDKAINLMENDGSFREVFEVIAGPGGAWDMLGQARVEASRTDGIFVELLKTRLAAYKVLKTARSRDAAGSDSGVPYEKWSRMQAHAQVELNEFAKLSSEDRAAHAEEVRAWQLMCDLSPPPR